MLESGIQGLGWFPFFFFRESQGASLKTRAQKEFFYFSYTRILAFRIRLKKPNLSKTAPTATARRRCAEWKKLVHRPPPVPVQIPQGNSTFVGGVSSKEENVSDKPEQLNRKEENRD